MEKAQKTQHLAIWGFHPVREFAYTRPDALIEVVHIPKFGRKKRERSLIDLLHKKGIPVREVSRLAELGIPSGTVHQGIAAKVQRIWELDEEKCLNEVIKASVEHHTPILACDDITDPQNFGAILRGAVAMGVNLIVTQRRGSAPVTGTVAKASSGAIALCKIVYCENLRRFLTKCKEYSWKLVGLAPDAKQFVWQQDLNKKAILILGSEEKGLRKTIRSLCETLVSIPLEGSIQSLNVSQASGIVLYEALRQKKTGSPGP